MSMSNSITEEKRKEQEKIRKDIEEFKKKGGKIEKVKPTGKAKSIKFNQHGAL